MAKSSIKEKSPIALRAKDLKGGRKSLYLDYYREGSKDHAHEYEFLKLYLLPETSKENRQLNRETLRSAKAIQAQRLLERVNGKANIKQNNSNILLVDYMEHFATLKAKYGQSDERKTTILKVIKHIAQYNSKVTLAQIDKAYIIGFIDYLSTAKSLKGKQDSKHKPIISKQTAMGYYQALTAILNYAVKEDIISSNPMSKVTAEEKKPIAPQGNTRTYLTAEEIKRLNDAKMLNKQVKMAFMFACFCGLRISDIRSLKWDNILTENGKSYILKNMVKTSQDVIIPLSEQAKSFLPEKKGVYVFELPHIATINSTLKVWAKRAKIEKNISFHTSRHTFATLLLTQGADLYTTSKLLGHTDISITQVYAEIVNQKRVEAVELLNNINI